MENAKVAPVKYNRAKPWQLILFTMNDVAFNVYYFGINFLSYFATGVVLSLIHILMLEGGKEIYTVSASFYSTFSYDLYDMIVMEAVSYTHLIIF